MVRRKLTFARPLWNGRVADSIFPMRTGSFRVHGCYATHQDLLKRELAKRQEEQRRIADAKLHATLPVAAAAPYGPLQRSTR
jgi:hypothetical protein